MIENKLSELAKLNKKSLYYNLPYNTIKDLNLILLSYATLSCLELEEVSIYKNYIKKLTFDCSIDKPTVFIDGTNKSIWEENNPECINRKQWERIALKICNRYTIEIEKIPLDVVCDISFEIVKKTISCEVLTTIALQKKLCDLNITINRTRDECATDYKLLIEKHPSCNLNKKEYFCLIDSNFSFEMVSLIYDNNLSLEVDSKGKVSLVSPIRRYKIPEELKVNDVIYTSDKQLIHKILQDYNISKKLKENIINELKQI